MVKKKGTITKTQMTKLIADLKRKIKTAKLTTPQRTSLLRQLKPNPYVKKLGRPKKVDMISLRNSVKSEAEKDLKRRITPTEARALYRSGADNYERNIKRLKAKKPTAREVRASFKRLDKRYVARQKREACGRSN